MFIVELEKETTVLIESAKEIQNAVANIPGKEETKESATAVSIDSALNNVDASPVKKETVTESAAKLAPPPQEGGGGGGGDEQNAETGEPKSETSPKPAVSKTTKRKAKVLFCVPGK